MSRVIISKILVAAFISVVIQFVSAGASAAQDWPPDGSFIRITRDGGLTPYVSVYYDVTVRGRSLVITMSKDTLCRVINRERMVLQDGPEASRTLQVLRDAGAWTIQPPAGASRGRASDTAADVGVARYEFWTASGRSMTRFFVPVPVLSSSPELVRVHSVLRGLVRSLVEPLPLRDVFQPADRTGILAITSSEPAVAVIDGWDRVRLPVSSLDLKVGVHEVVVTGASGAVRNFTVRVVPGENPAIHVLLDDRPVPSSPPPSGP